MSTVHAYRCRVGWSGSTGEGYPAYSREDGAAAPPGETELRPSADPAFLGDAARLNPEQLLLVAASSCRLLSFLAIAARARIDVVAYDDGAEATMPEDAEPVRIAAITLRPTIVVPATWTSSASFAT
ncbi:MAG TPA: OsmC family protein [Solirubrobacteraceae bacterium]|nr:OsmC family protein [Solirubrobacteraceae bacterium]